jgi:hypothetical protein
MVDGSAHFIADSITPQTMRFLITRGEGDQIDQLPF